MKYISTYLLAIVSMTMFSCSGDWLDLKPSTSVTTDEAMKTLTDAQSALNGVYRLASAHSYYGDNLLYFGDCRAEDVQARISKGDGKRVSPYYEYNVKADDSFNTSLPWNQIYKVIRQTNNIIHYIDGIETTDETSALRIKSEALAMRGLALYDLVRVFAMPYMYDNGASLGVPTEIEISDASHKPKRNTVAECYNQVIEDMTNALGGLSKEKTDGYLNYWAVKGLLSRVYLNMGNYKEAYDAAVDVIENSKSIYKLYTTEEYPEVWGKDFQSESLFEFYFSLTEPSGGSGGEGVPMVYENEESIDWNNLILTKAYLDLLNEDPDDVRHCWLEASLIENNEGLPEKARSEKVYLNKYPGKNGDPHDNDLCIVRLSEIYLNAAEAGFKLGTDLNTARGYLNAIVSRANPNKSVSADEFTLERILKERRKELVGEGLALYDYTRNKLQIRRDEPGNWHLNTLAPENSNAVVIEYNDLRHAVPIPQTEIDANPNIDQNPR